MRNLGKLVFVSAVCSIGAAVTLAQTQPSESPLPAGSILVDDKDTAFITTLHSVKPTTPEKTMPHGGTVLDLGYWNKTGVGERGITVSPQIDKEGWYDVQMRWAVVTRLASSFGKAAMTITHADGVDDFTVRQSSGDRWVSFGVYRLKAGKNPVLSMTDKGTTGLANFDAARFIPAQQPKAPPALKLPAAADEYSKLRRQIVQGNLNAEYGLEGSTDPSVLERARDAERDAAIMWQTMIMHSDDQNAHIWNQFPGKASHNLTAEAAALRDMAAAYVGSPDRLGFNLRGNPKLLDDIVKGLDLFTKRYNLKTKWDVNWFDFEIGVPGYVLPTIIMIEDHVSPELKQHYVDSILRFTADPRKMYNNGFPAKGANLLWMARNHVQLGYVQRNAERIALSAKCAIEPLAYVKPRVSKDGKKVELDEGYYHDGAFRQHGMPFIAAYGFLLLETYADVATSLRGTPWEVKGENAQNPFVIMENSFDPVVVRGETIATVVGRSLGSQNYEGNENAANFVSVSAALLPFADAPQKARLQSLVKKWLVETPDNALLAESLRKAKIQQVEIINEIAADASIKPLPTRVGCEVFPPTDQTMHRAGNFAVALGMNSIRTTAWESIWGANRKGWYHSEGILLLYTPDIERYRDAYWNLIDPYRYPGTTIERVEREPAGNGGANPGKTGGGSFVGGATLGNVGASAMHLKSRDTSVEGRRAWFFVGDRIICLGAGFTAKNNIETTVENARLIDDKQTLLVAGKPADPAETQHDKPTWVHLSGKRSDASLSWVFLGDNPPLKTLIDTRKGSRSDTHNNGSKAPLEMRFATLWLDHGPGDKPSGYSYLIAPNRTPAQTAELAKSPGVQVLNNTPELQKIKAGSFTGIIAWQPVDTADSKISQPAIVVIDDTASVVRIGVSDPTMLLAQSVRIELPIKTKVVVKADEGIKVVQQSPLIIEANLTGMFGRTLTVECSK